MKPTLFVLAAGMGSRYGGLKQLDGVGPHGETIMDYSIYDAMRAGFGKVVFVIRHDFEDAFREKILSKYQGHIPVEVVFQSVDALPEGYTVPEGRTKPWGTNHAVMMGESAIEEPFAVINADDFYGRDAFDVMAGFLAGVGKESDGRYCMVAFELGNTMTEAGSVSRGVCTVDECGHLTDVVERTSIAFTPAGEIEYTDKEGNSGRLMAHMPVSMNLWGFTPDYFRYSRREFVRFLNKHIERAGSEFFIPSVVDKLVKNGEATVDVLSTKSRWFGVTYPEDRDKVVASLAALHNAGEYPDKLF
ncbi:MAG: nucleotidyltransferase [Muribaculaceae bacterium]|jgi:hypothetical protein